MSQIHKLTFAFALLCIFSVCKSSVPDVIVLPKDVIGLPKSVLNMSGALYKENEGYTQAKKHLQNSTNDLSDQLKDLDTRQSTRIQAYSSDLGH